MSQAARDKSGRQGVPSKPLLRSYTVMTGLAVAAAMLILIGVMLPSETSRPQERWADPVGIVLAVAFVSFVVFLWVRRPRPRNAALFLVALVIATIISDYAIMTLA